MTKNDARVLFLRCLGRWITAAEAEGIRFLVYTFHRTAADQAQKYNERKSQVVYSQHQDWLAVDIVLLGDGDEAIWADHPHYRRLGEIWKAQHPLCRWGGDWKTLKDLGHLEISREWRDAPAP